MPPRNLKLTLEYEGTAYLGWSRQPQGMTIQQALEEALAHVFGKPVSASGASRTDAGVHACGQVANVALDTDLSPDRLRGALNALLPRDIAVVKVEDVPMDFSARFSATGKLYHYVIWSQSVRPVLERNFCWHLRWPLNLELMQQAADRLIGRQDFAAFQSANAQSETTVRTITSARWSSAGQALLFAIEADAFLYNMVRAIVGTLTEVGRGKMTPDEFSDVIASRDRRRAGRTAPPQGLCLMRVDYPPMEAPTPQ